MLNLESLKQLKKNNFFLKVNQFFKNRIAKLNEPKIKGFKKKKLFEEVLSNIKGIMLILSNTRS